MSVKEGEGNPSSQGMVLVDTNILVYTFDDSDKERQRLAEAIFSELAESERIRLSTQVLQEFYVTMTRKVNNRWSPDQALAVMDDLAAWPVVTIDFSAIREAVLLSKDAQISFWDALIVIAAVNSGASILYTEDLNHGQIVSGVKVINPFCSQPDNDPVPES